jgi:hypothetical protein
VTTYAPGGNRGISWSPDGRFAFVGSREAEQFKHLVVVDVRRRRVRVVESGLEDGTAAWSPDGRTIAFASATRHEARSAIYTVEADGGGRRRLTPRWPPYYDQSPVWSRDGKRLLFVRSAVGGGAAAYVPEVWSTHADGSHQRRLTTAFPRGGGNVEAAWFSGAVHAEPAARTVQTQRGGRIVLRVPFPVDGVSADGARTAIAPVSHAGQEDIIPTPPILVWRPGHGEPRRLVTSGCSVQNLVLAGRRLAFDCDHSFLDEIAQSLWVFDLRTGLPREAFFGHGAVFANGSTLSRTIVLDHIVGGGSLLAFGSEELRPHRALQRALWRIDGFGSIALRARPGTGELVAAGGSRLAIEYPTGAVAITRPDGTLARGLRLRRRPAETSDKLPFLLEGRELLVLDRGHLLAVDTVTGLIRWRRSLPRGAELEDADDGLVVYTVGSSIHMVSRRGETILRTGARRLRRLRADVERPVYAALTPIGLFYSFNVADRRFPGRVVFVPRAQLPG